MKINLAQISAYDNSSAGWKLDDDGNVVLKDGNPVYVKADGTEQTVASDTISRLNIEAKNHREAKEAVEAKLKVFEGIDPNTAREALEKVSKLEAKELIDSGKVDEVKQQITQQFTTQLQEKEQLASKLQEKLDNMLVTNVFNSSEFVRDSLAVPRDMFEASFRGHFKVEDGNVVAYGKDGNRLFSKTRAGEYADPDEALQLLVEAHPQKDVIIKANAGNGTGNNGAGGTRVGNRTIKRSEFEGLAPNKQAEVIAKVRAGEATIAD